MDHWDVFRSVSVSKLLNEQADRCVQKILEYDIQTILHSLIVVYILLFAFSRNIDIVSPKSRKRDQKI